MLTIDVFYSEQYTYPICPPKYPCSFVDSPRKYSALNLSEILSIVHSHNLSLFGLFESA